MGQPLKKISAGQVSAAIWENDMAIDGRNVKVLKASVERRYKDRDGNWKSSSSFGRNEIPLAIYCLEKAFETIVEERSINGSIEAVQTD